VTNKASYNDMSLMVCNSFLAAVIMTLQGQVGTSHAPLL